MEYLDRFSKHCVCLIRGYLCSKFQQNQTKFGRLRAQIKMGHFMDVVSKWKTLTFFDFTTTSICHSNENYHEYVS